MNLKELELLYINNSKRIYKFFYFKTFDRQTAEDLTSETFLALAAYIKNDKDINKVEALLFKIASNLFNAYLRRKYSEIDIDDSVLDQIPQVEELDKINNESLFLKYILKFLNRLPNKQMIILKKRLIDKKNLRTISEELGKDLNYIKTTQKRGIKKLKEMLSKQII